MLERARGLSFQFPKQRIIGVTKLPQTRARDQAEHLFEQVDQRVPSHIEHRSDEHVKDSFVGVITDHPDETEREVSDNQADKDYGGGDELLPSLIEILEGEHSDDTGHSEHHI